MIGARWTGLGAAAIAGVIVGMALGWMLWRPKPPKPEPYAPAVVQQDGSLVLERKPMPDAKPAQQVPKGARVERVVQVKVQPRNATPTAATGTPGSGPVNVLPELPPVTVDLSLVRLPDQTRRVIASSPDGEVIGGVDIPVEAAREVKVLRWAAGYEFAASTWSKTHSVLVQRDLGAPTPGRACRPCAPHHPHRRGQHRHRERPFRDGSILTPRRSRLGRAPCWARFFCLHRTKKQWTA